MQSNSSPLETPVFIGVSDEKVKGEGILRNPCPIDSILFYLFDSLEVPSLELHDNLMEGGALAKRLHPRGLGIALDQ